MPTIDRPSSTALARFVRRLLFLVAYHGWVRHALRRTVRTRFLGFTLLVPPSVFHPRYYFTSRFFAETIASLSLAGKKVLDVGCGSGILSLAAAKSGGSVTAVDINPAAVQATSHNAALNGLSSSICTIHSDIFDDLIHTGTTFDFMICNPPYYVGEPFTMAERAFKGGSNLQFFSRFASGSKSLLAPDGSILLVLSSDADVNACLRPFRDRGFSVRFLRSRRLLFETLALFELRA